jgi:hypothetical protein
MGIILDTKAVQMRMGIILNAAAWGAVRMRIILDAMAQKSPALAAGLPCFRDQSLTFLASFAV